MISGPPSHSSAWDVREEGLTVCSEALSRVR